MSCSVVFLFCLFIFYLQHIYAQSSSVTSLASPTPVASLASPTSASSSDSDILKAKPDHYITNEDTILVIDDPKNGLLANASDSHHDVLTVTVISPPQFGILNLDSTKGTFSYTPNQDFNGEDSFDYSVSDGHQSDSASVHIHVLPVNDLPVAVSDSYQAQENKLLAVNQDSGVLSNDYDVDDTNLTVKAIGEGPNFGSLQLYSDGSFAYKPNKNFYGVDSFNYTVSDPHGGTAKGSVTITTQYVCADPSSALCISFVDSLIWTATQDSFSVNEDNTLSLLNQSLLNAHVDTQSASANQINLVARLLSNPTNGNVRFYSNGTFLYAPYDNYFGQDTFNYSIVRIVSTNGVDSTVNQKNFTVLINVLPQQDPPVANDDYYVTNEDTNLIISSYSQGILANDSDVDGDALAATILSGPSHGQFQSFDANTGAFVYVPDSDFNGLDWFSYRVSDPAKNSDDANVTILILPVNDLPLANDDSYLIGQNQMLSANGTNGVLANDSDKETQNQYLKSALQSQPLHGRIRFYPNGSFNYIPNHNYVGSDSFAYNVIDTDNGTSVGHVNISIFPRTSGLLIFYLLFIIFIVLLTILLVFLRLRKWNPFNDPEISGPNRERLFDDES